MGTNHVWSVLFEQSSSAQRSSFFERPVRFDSGDPLFLVLNRSVVLLGTYNGDNFVDACSSYLVEIQSVMDALCSGCSVEVVPFTEFPVLARRSEDE